MHDANLAHGRFYVSMQYDMKSSRAFYINTTFPQINTVFSARLNQHASALPAYASEARPAFLMHM